MFFILSRSKQSLAGVCCSHVLHLKPVVNVIALWYGTCKVLFCMLGNHNTRFTLNEILFCYHGASYGLFKSFLVIIIGLRMKCCVCPVVTEGNGARFLGNRQNKYSLIRQSSYANKIPTINSIIYSSLWREKFIFKYWIFLDIGKLLLKVQGAVRLMPSKWYCRKDLKGEDWKHWYAHLWYI